MTAIDGWMCVTCGTRVCTPHCCQCGEAEIRASDLGFRHLLIEAFHALTNVDSRLLRSFRTLLVHPGTLTTAYLEGPRKPYISPIEIFLLANVLFFAIQAITPDKVFSSSLASHLYGQDWSALARSMVSNRLAAKHVTLEAYAPVFDHAVAVNARALVFAMGVPFALLLTVLLIRGPRQFAAHVVFTLHFYAFQLLILCPLLAVLLVETWFGGSGVASGWLDVALFAIQLGTSAAYLHVATGKVYGVRGTRRFLLVAALIAAVGCVVLGYRFFIFVVTLFGT